MYRRIEIGSELDSLRIVEKEIDVISAELEIGEDNYGKIMVCTMEAVNNAIIHGNKSDNSKKVSIEIKSEEGDLIISVEDEGPGFIPKNIPDPTRPENIENLSGRGVFLMSKLADKTEFNEKGNRVSMTFKDIRT